MPDLQYCIGMKFSLCYCSKHWVQRLVLNAEIGNSLKHCGAQNKTVTLENTCAYGVACILIETYAKHMTNEHAVPEVGTSKCRQSLSVAVDSLSL